MNEPDTCPACGANLQGSPIPQEHIDKGCYSPGSTHYSRRIGIYDMERDRTVAWHCPDCGHEWPRDTMKP